MQDWVVGLRSLIVLMFSLGHVCFTYTTVAYHMYISMSRLHVAYTNIFSRFVF